MQTKMKIMVLNVKSLICYITVVSTWQHNHAHTSVHTDGCKCLAVSCWNIVVLPCDRYQGTMTHVVIGNCRKQKVDVCKCAKNSQLYRQFSIESSTRMSRFKIPGLLKLLKFVERTPVYHIFCRLLCWRCIFFDFIRKYSQYSFAGKKKSNCRCHCCCYFLYLPLAKVPFISDFLFAVEIFHRFFFA